MEYCCDSLKGHLTNKCEQHGLSCPDNIVQIMRNGDYAIPHVDLISYYVIKYCPWCGTKLEKWNKS